MRFSRSGSEEEEGTNAQVYARSGAVRSPSARKDGSSAGEGEWGGSGPASGSSLCPGGCVGVQSAAGELGGGVLTTHPNLTLFSSVDCYLLPCLEIK